MRENSMTTGNVAKQIFIFTLPIMAGNFLQQLYSTVDGIVVGQFVGEEALAAVGTCSPLVILFLALAIGMSVGSGIVVAQYFGAGRNEDLRKAASTSIILLGGIGLVFSIIGALVAEPILEYVLAVPAEELPYATLYMRIYCAGLLFQFVYNIVASILRALGDSRATLYFLCISAGLNIVLDLVFVMGLRLGIPGAAWATVISQIASSAAALIYMSAKYENLRFGRAHGGLVFDGEMAGTVIRLGIPSTLQQACVSLGHIGLQRLVNSFGVEFMAGYTAGTRIESYLVIPALGFQAGVSTFTGQNVGAGNWERVKEGTKKTCIMSLLITCVLSAVAIIFSTPLISFFGVEGESLAMGIGYISLAAWFFPIFGIYQGFVGTLQGAGDVMFTASATLTSLAVRVISSYMLAPGTGYRSLCWSMLCGWGYVLTLSFVRYIRGKWKEKAVA